MSFLFSHTAPSGFYPLSLHDALPILRFALDRARSRHDEHLGAAEPGAVRQRDDAVRRMKVAARELVRVQDPDRKSTRLNSSHSQISYAVFCLKKKTNIRIPRHLRYRQ